uniref:Uncharacterized protein n=1 Tax=Solanum tuberosum TaxID=4113 RepID=M1DFN4_SOLTU
MVPARLILQNVTMAEDHAEKLANQVARRIGCPFEGATGTFGETNLWSPSPIGASPNYHPYRQGIMETGNETQALVGEITLSTLLEVLNDVRGDISKMNERLTTMEGRVNSNDSTPQATFRATTSGQDHTHSPTLTPGTLH